MLYLIDASARNSLGHNLEYLERISLEVKSHFLILGNRELKSNGDSNYRPTFEFATWDFGRFGHRRKRIKPRAAQSSKTLRSSRALLITEKFIEISAKALARIAGRFVLFAVGHTKQSRCFHRDLTRGLFGIKPFSTILVSTTNARELVGLNKWTQNLPIQGYSISVILRRPLLDLRSLIEVPLIFIDALIYISAIQELANRVRFLADTPGLAARLSKRTAEKIEHIPTLGFEIQIDRPKGPMEFALAPNSRPETRYSVHDLTSIPKLSALTTVNLDSKGYRELLSTTKSIVLPYDPLRYRSRSSGIFAEALTLGILPIVPTGTSMSQEIAKLNSKILPPPELVMELKVGGVIDFRLFEQEYLLITLEGNFCGSIVLEISESNGGIKRSTHDFFESESIDSFLIRPTKQTLMTFKMDRILFPRDHSLNIKVNRIGSSLFGAPYLEGDLLEVLSLIDTISFHSEAEFEIREHSPRSICSVLKI